MQLLYKYNVLNPLIPNFKCTFQSLPSPIILCDQLYVNAVYMPC